MVRTRYLDKLNISRRNRMRVFNIFAYKLDYHSAYHYW